MCVKQRVDKTMEKVKEQMNDYTLDELEEVSMDMRVRCVRNRMKDPLPMEKPIRRSRQPPRSVVPPLYSPSLSSKYNALVEGEVGTQAMDIHDNEDQACTRDDEVSQHSVEILEDEQSHSSSNLSC